ncbi:MAG: histidine kinase [Gemmatimonadota bacterium]
MIWRKWNFWLVLVMAATCIGLLEAAQVYAGTSALGRPMPWRTALASTMPSWYLLAALLPAIIWASRKFPLEPGRWRLSLVVHVLVATVFAVFHVTASSWISDAILYTGRQQPWDFRGNISRLLSIYFVVELFTYFALVAGYHAYEYGKRYRERERATALLQLRATRLEANLAQATLDSLRMQLNPHFLFNTLNTISVMALKGERHGVVRMLALLSDLLRLSLQNTQQVVSLRQELEFLDHYLEIEQVRFRDRLTIERDIEQDALDAEVPSLLLQPLVENAIHHGIARRAGPGTVRLEAGIVTGEVLELRVLDTGVGLGAPAGDSTGLGLSNTRARLEQLYGDRHELELTDRPGGGACVTVRLPLRILTREQMDATGRGIGAFAAGSASA